MNSLFSSRFARFDILLNLWKEREGSRGITSPLQLDLWCVLYRWDDAENGRRNGLHFAVFFIHTECGRKNTPIWEGHSFG